MGHAVHWSPQWAECSVRAALASAKPGHGFVAGSGAVKHPTGVKQASRRPEWPQGAEEPALRLRLKPTHARLSSPVLFLIVSTSGWG